MRDHEYRDGGRPEDLLQELGYETQDIQYKKFAKYGFYFLGFFLSMIVAGFVVMYAMVPTRLKGGRMADYEPRIKPPTNTPLLQSNITARTDIMSLRRQESKEMTAAEPIDEKHGVYRIPVNQAINILASRGLPKTPPMPVGGSAAQMGAAPDGAGSPDMNSPILETRPAAGTRTGGESATTPGGLSGQ